jgi:hypothetical protein
MVFMDNAIRQRQTQPYPFAYGLGGEEGGEDFLQVFRCDAYTGVGDVHPHLIALLSGTDGDRAVLIQYLFEHVQILQGIL